MRESDSEKELTGILIGFVVATLLLAAGLYFAGGFGSQAQEPTTYTDVKPMCGVKRGKDVVAFRCEQINGEWVKVP